MKPPAKVHAPTTALQRAVAHLDQVTLDRCFHMALRGEHEAVERILEAHQCADHSKIEGWAITNSAAFGRKALTDKRK